MLAMLGLALFIWDVLFDRTFLKNKMSRLLCIMLAVLLLSSLANIRYGIAKSARVLVWQTVLMLVMFPLCYRIREQKRGTFLVAVHTISSLVIIPAAIVSLYQFCFLISYSVDIDGDVLLQGLHDGRLFGVFGSISFGCLFCAILCISSLYLAVRSKNILLRVLYCFESVVCIAYIILSDTRSVQVGLIAVVFVGSFVVCKRFLGRRVSNALCKSLLCTAVAVFAVACGIGLYSLGKCQLRKIPVYIAYEYYNTTDKGSDTAVDTSGASSSVGNLDTDPDPLPDTTPETETDVIPDTTPGQSPDTAPETEPEASDTGENESYDTQPPETDQSPFDRLDSIPLERVDPEPGNISNGRFRIWQDYIDIMLSDVKVMLLGYGPGHYMDAIRENYPESFIVSKIRAYYPENYDRGIICDTHNAYLSIFVTCGVIGVIAMGAFLVCCAIKTFKYLLLTQRPSGYVLLLSVLLLMILVVVFFVTDLFFICTDISMLFWIVGGFLLAEIDRNTNKDRNLPSHEHGTE